MIKIGEIRLGGLRAEGAGWRGRRQARVQADVDAGGQKRRRMETQVDRDAGGQKHRLTEA